MNKDTLDLLQQTFGTFGQYIFLTLLATTAFFYLANQVFSIRKLSLEHRGKKLDEVKALLDAVEKKKDLLIEEAFFFSYGFPIQSKEVNYITARDNQRSLIFDLKNSRSLLSYNPITDSYEYKKRFSLDMRDQVQSVIYWLSAISAYVTFLFSIGIKAYPLLIFVAIFGLTTFASLEQIKFIAATKRVLSGSTFPLKNQDATPSLYPTISDASI